MDAAGWTFHKTTKLAHIKEIGASIMCQDQDGTGWTNDTHLIDRAHAGLSRYQASVGCLKVVMENPSVNILDLKEENKKLKVTSHNILNRMEVLEDGLCSKSAAVPDRKAASFSDEFCIIGTAEDYYDISAVQEPTNSLSVRSLKLHYVLLDSSKFFQLLSKFTNLRSLQLSHLHFFDQIYEKVELNFLESFELSREPDPQDPELMENLTLSTDELESQIFFTKCCAKDNLFSLKTRIKLQLGPYVLNVDPACGTIVSNLTCTAGLLEKYTKSASPFKLKKLGLGDCRVEFEPMKDLLLTVKSLSLSDVTFIHCKKCRREVSEHNVLTCLRRLERLRLGKCQVDQVSPSIRSFPYATLKELHLLDDTFDFTFSPPEVQFHLDLLVVSTEKYFERIFETFSPIRVVLLAGFPQQHLLLAEVLQCKSPGTARTQWIWIRGFKRLSKSDNIPGLAAVEDILNQYLPENCTDFTLKRMAGDSWRVQENGSDCIERLSSKFLLDWDKFVDL